MGIVGIVQGLRELTSQFCKDTCSLRHQDGAGLVHCVQGIPQFHKHAVT